MRNRDSSPVVSGLRDAMVTMGAYLQIHRNNHEKFVDLIRNALLCTHMVVHMVDKLTSFSIHKRPIHSSYGIITSTQVSDIRIFRLFSPLTLLGARMKRPKQWAEAWCKPWPEKFVQK